MAKRVGGGDRVSDNDSRAVNVQTVTPCREWRVADGLYVSVSELIAS